MSQSMDSDLHLGQIAVRMGIIAPQDLPTLLQEARAGHAEESAGRATSLAQILLRRRILSVSDYMYMASQARLEERSEAAPLEDLAVAYKGFESGSLDASSFEEILSTSGEPLSRPQTQQTFGRYALLGEVARGGMGIVYQARDTENNKIVALKVMIEADDDEIRLQRFEREAELAAALDHPGIVRIHDAGRVEGIPYFTMDLVSGDSLDDLFEGPGVDRDVAIKALSQVARAVDHAHQRGIIHRDLKPGNVLIDRKTRHARVTDFGLARDLSRGTRLTQVGQAVGTPYYMAPEQVRGERDVDGRCDIYAIGVILYEVLTGDVPFDADSPLSLFKKIDREEVVLELNPAAGIDERIHTIVMCALAKEREDRYSRGNLLAEDLERYMAGEEPRGRPYGLREGLRRRVSGNPWVLAAAVLSVMAVVVFGALGLIAHRRLKAGRREARGHSAATDLLAQLQSSESKAREALSEGEPSRATAEARRGLEVFERLEALLSSAGSRGAGVRRAFSEEGGEEVGRRLEVELARALVLEAGTDLSRVLEAQSALDVAKRSAPRDLPLRLASARFLRDGGREEDALEELNAALEVEPTNADALIERALLLCALGREEKAAGDLSQALLRRTGDVRALVERSRIYLLLGRLQAARVDAQDARSLAPEALLPVLAVGDVLRAEGKRAAALAAYEQGAALAPDDPRPHLRTGDLCLEAGSFEAAGAAYERADSRGGGWRATLGLARVHAGLLEPARGLRRAEEALVAIGAAPRRGRLRAKATVLALLGQLALVSENVVRAREAFREAAEAAPRVALPRVWLARLDLAEGLTRQAAARVAEIEPTRDDPDLLAVRSRIALAGANTQLALSLAERAVAASSSHARARTALAAARLQAEAGDSARAACDAAWVDAIRGGDLASCYLRRAREWVELGLVTDGSALLDRARPLLAAALRLDPQRARTWATLGALERGRRRFTVAWDALDRAARQDPFSPKVAVASMQLAFLQPRPGRLEVARVRLERAIEFHGATSLRLILQARGHIAVEQWGEALVDLDRAARLKKRPLAVQTLRAQVLEALGRDEDAGLAAKRIRELGVELDSKRDALVREARRLAKSAPQRALELANQALDASDLARHTDCAEVARLAATLMDEPTAQLQVVSQTLAAASAQELHALDRTLAKGWTAPLRPSARRRLRLAARRGGLEAGLAMAMAAVYDGLAGLTNARVLREGLEFAEGAVLEAPGSLAGHFARAYLRVHTGDAGRGLRELRVLAEVAPDLALVHFAQAEAAAAAGNPDSGAIGRARAAGLPKLKARLRRSRFVN